MIFCNAKLFRAPSPVSLFLWEHHVDLLIRSAEWYKLPPLTRYILNMAANDIRMEDAKTELRVYDHARFDAMSEYLDRADANPSLVAYQVWRRWQAVGLSFGIVHLDQTDGHAGDLLVGDSPEDVSDLVVETYEDNWDIDFAVPAHGPEGSDA